MLAIVGMVYALGHISGCHINPAITVALATTGKFPWREVPGYVTAQLLGATAGGLAIVGTLGKAAADLGLGMASYSDTTPWGRATFAELIGTALLAFVVFGVVDRRAVPGWAGLAIGASVFAVIVVVGPATGAAINPARYVGPMLAGELFDATVNWSQLPAYLVGEFGGALAGALEHRGPSRTWWTAGISLGPFRPRSVVMNHEPSQLETAQRAGMPRMTACTARAHHQPP
jgi:glycerol uptake facilitator protein